MKLDPDLEIIKQCQSDDPVIYEKAFNRIYRKYGERAYNIAYRILGNAEDALDVTQDAFLTVFKKVSNFRKDSRFFTWFYRIVVNLSIDRKRKQASTPYLVRSDSESVLSDLPDPQIDSVEKLAQEEFMESSIQASFMKLSPNLRTVTVLRYIDGLSYAEIAETLECSIGTVKSRLNRAHRMLQTLLQPLLAAQRSTRKKEQS
ncbi:MAG: RNA polymerase sigma factor [Planctomycetota bacterium]|jgi:RNA polymerase sigma-70 factor (ECF subfamily)